MARLLFCVDHIFQRGTDGLVYTTGGRFPYAKWQEYLEFFDQIDVVGRTSELRGDVAKAALSSGPRVVHHVYDDLRGARRLASLGSQRKLLERLVRSADAVIARIPGEIGIAACSVAAKAGKPYLVELVACPWDALWNHGWLTARAYAPLMTMRTRRAARNAGLVHYVTREFLQRRYPTRAPYVCASNVVLVAPEPGLVERRIERLRTMRAGARPIVFGTIGSMLTNYKGIDLAIRALAEQRDTLPPFVYRVLGEGDPARFAKVAAKSGVSDRVHFDGVLPGPPEVAGWLDSIDVFLLPSYQEGLPRSLIEAMNRACLAIGSTAGGIPELLPPERTHAPGNWKRLREVISTVVGAPDAVLEAEVRRNFEVAQRYSYERSLAEKRRAYRALRQWVDTGGAPVLPGTISVDAAE